MRQNHVPTVTTHDMRGFYMTQARYAANDNPEKLAWPVAAMVILFMSGCGWAFAGGVLLAMWWPVESLMCFAAAFVALGAAKVVNDNGGAL